VDTYLQATEQALSAGYRGLRVAADATDLARTRAQRDAFVRYEHLIDQGMADVPFSAMYAYDRRVLGEAASELACAHPI
jgi:hypothetical protein